jgi:hypothetical protein
MGLVWTKTGKRPSNTKRIQCRGPAPRKMGPIFDKYKSARALAGFNNERVVRNADDPTKVIIWGTPQAGRGCAEHSQVQNSKQR